MRPSLHPLPRNRNQKTQQHTRRSLILNFTQTRHYMRKVWTKLTNIPQVKCGFQYTDFLENRMCWTALCEDFYNEFLKDQSRYGEVSCINTLTPFSEAWVSLVHSSGTSACSTTLPEELPNVMKDPTGGLVADGRSQTNGQIYGQTEEVMEVVST